MPYKTVLVSAGPEAWSDTAVGAALDVSQMFGAEVIGAGAEAFLPTVGAESLYLDAAMAQVLRDQIDINLDRAEKRFNKLTAAAPHGARWHTDVEVPARAVTRLSRAADLIVLARPPKHISDTKACYPSDVVMDAGLPVLLAPQSASSLRASRIVIGWKDTREVRRAISDALPFLMHADNVYLAEFPEDSAGNDSGIEEVAVRLSRHGVDVRIERPLLLSDSIAEGLEGFAREVSADLIVLGAYGHSRLREWAFGGVTKDFMADSECFVLLSH